MYTQCPKCLTYFQVTAEHLKVAQGNVRCGQCSNVFSALGNLSEVPPQQNSATTKTQSNNSGSTTARSVPKNTPRPTTTAKSTGTNPQSKLTSAIAAIQALNQSSQKILSQGRKNYVTQLQKQAQANRNYSSPAAKDATARDLNQEDLEAASIQPGQSDADADFDIEEALAAVEDIGVDESSIQYRDESEENIASAIDGSDLTQDYKNDKSTLENNRKGKKHPKYLKSDVSDDDIFDFSEMDLPEEEIEISSDRGKKTTAKKPNKTKQTPAKKQPTKVKGRSPASVAVQKAISEANQTEVVYSDTAGEQALNIPQNVISDPDVIIENNIPTLAIPKALLEDFEQEKVSHTNYRSMLTWGGLSILMMIIFLGQAIYFKHNELGQISQFRPWVEMFCKHASCELSLQADIAKIELLGQDIRTHPKNDGALLVSATIINNASFTQPYPGLQLSFSDINGVKVATRNFLPKDYLPSKYSRKKGMESNIPIQLELELIDPGKSAVNFEFDFFSI